MNIQVNLSRVINTHSPALQYLLYRNLTVSPCGRSAGTVPEPPELDTKNKIIVIND